MYVTAIAGNGAEGGGASHRGRAGRRGRASRLAALHLLYRLQPEDLKFSVHTYVGKDIYYNITATGSTAYTPNCVSSRSPRWSSPRRRIPRAHIFYLFCPGDTCPSIASTRRLGAACALRPHMRSNRAKCAYPPFVSSAHNALIIPSNHIKRT